MPPPPPRPPKSSAKPASTVGDSSDSEIGAEKRSELSSCSDGVLTTPQGLEMVTELNAAGGEGPKTDEQMKKEKEKEKSEGNSCAQTSFKEGVYTIPAWSAASAFPFSLEVIKDGTLVDTLNVSLKGTYMFGRSDHCDFMLEHPSISRYHAVLQFKRTGDVFIYDLGSTHGTVVNKKQVSGRTYIPLHVGDVLKFGLSSRLYVLQGPTELMPKEGPTKAQRQLLRQSQTGSDLTDQEASILRARREAMQMGGATWGMMEDAVEDETQEEEEITWQTFKGQLSEKQQKTLEKIHKRNEKISSLKREIDAIQVKEIPQGGLTQGQQTQVARNQQRIEQLMEELENLEETLNQSIQESMGARARKGSFREGMEDGVEDLSDDDDFYDRTCHGKGKTTVKGGEPAQVVETAESLLEKRGKIIKDIERLTEEVDSEKKNHAEICQDQEPQDTLDAFMTDVSSKLESDRASGLRKEIEKQQIELDKVIFLLKIADPSGEALKKWHNEPRSTSPWHVADAHLKQAIEKTSKKDPSSKIEKETSSKTTVIDEELRLVSPQVDEQDKRETESSKGRLWLGHARKNVVEKTTTDNLAETSTGKEFLEYKERHKATMKMHEHDSSQDILEDAHGLILRKPTKDVAKEDTHTEDREDEKSMWEGAALTAADTVALLLRHQKGLGAAVEELEEERAGSRNEEISNTTKKRRLGPEKPVFLNKEEAKFQAWVPPAGQTGDGRTALNDKYGY